MDKRVKALWIDALEGGEYQQATGVLKNTDEDGSADYCCLGVLCDLAIKDGVDVKVKNLGDCSVFDGEGMFLPSSVVEWAGLPRSDHAGELKLPISYIGLYDRQRIAENLTHLNDGAKYSFNQIADVIKDQF